MIYTPETAEHWYRVLGNYGRRRCHRIEDAEDFRAWAIERMIRGRKATAHQLYVDYLRETLGRNGKKNPTFVTDVVVPDHSGRKPDRVMDERDADRRIKRLRERERVVASLATKWGFNEGEIADCVGVSPSRICQIIAGLRQSVSAPLQPIRQDEAGSYSGVEDEGTRRRTRAQKNRRIQGLANVLPRADQGPAEGEMAGFLCSCEVLSGIAGEAEEIGDQEQGEESWLLAELA